MSAIDRANQALARLVEGYRGGEKFAQAIRSGDVCSRADAAERRRLCKACPGKVDASIFGLVPSSWCGPPLEDRTGEEYGSARTCGCLLLGKTLVASEVCPRGEWDAVKPRTASGGAARRGRRAQRIGAKEGDA